RSVARSSEARVANRAVQQAVQEGAEGRTCSEPEYTRQVRHGIVERMSDQVRITRRGLFRGIGSATVLAGCKASERPPHEAEQGSQQPGPGEGAAAVGPGPAPLQFTLNGQQQTLHVEPHVTLLAALREQLRVTGTKVVCDRGACGACTVLVDGVARNSCM